MLLIEGEKFPVAITSKYPIGNVQKVSDNMDRGFIIARIKDFYVVSLHSSISKLSATETEYLPSDNSRQANSLDPPDP